MDRTFETDLDPRTADYFRLIEQYVDSNRDEIVSDMQKILTFETVSGGEKEDQRKCRAELDRGFQWLAGRATDMGFEYRDIDGLVSVIEQSGESGSIGVLLHLDVVPPGEGWTQPPFSGALAAGEIFGRGAQDDKGPIVQTMHALNAVQSIGPLRKSVRLIVGSEEETGTWNDVARYLEVEGAPDMSIVPDGSFPVVNGEKGMVDLMCECSPDGEERGPIRILSCSSGNRPNVVPPLATLELALDDEGLVDALRAAIEKVRERNPDASVEMEQRPSDSGGLSVSLTFHGKNAHGSRPWLGHNAARDACRFVAQLPDMNGPRARFMAVLPSLIDDDLAGGLGIANEHDFLGPTSQNLGILRVDDGVCSATINVRQSPELTAADVLNGAREAFAAASDGLAIEVRQRGKSYEPLYIDPDNHPEFFRALYSAYTTVTNRPFTLKGLSGTTFAKAFPNAMCFGPTDPETDEELEHQADERISVEQLLRNVKIYALAIALLALGEE